MALSNFRAREDRETGHILVFLPRFVVAGDEGDHKFTADLSQVIVAI